MNTERKWCGFSGVTATREELGISSGKLTCFSCDRILKAKRHPNSNYLYQVPRHKTRKS